MQETCLQGFANNTGAEQTLFNGSPRDKNVGYNLDIMRQSVCQVVIPISVYSYGFLFNYTKVGQVSDSMTDLTKSFNLWVVP